MSDPPTSTPAPLDEDQIAAYVDGELSPEEAAAVEARLADDPDARAEVEDLRRMLRIVSDLPAVEPPPDFADRVVRKLRRARATRPEGPPLALLSLPFQVLSILVILVVAVLYMMAELDERPVSGPVRETPPAVRPATDAAPGGQRPVVP
ncbi:MAG: hypothetical protein D6705_15780 [Deltaproteobacteria bacterium]|nr:MAG: hypothetical protein D6705_15780 [Deltaproteobacteria bacterium]